MYFSPHQPSSFRSLSQRETSNMTCNHGDVDDTANLLIEKSFQSHFEKDAAAGQCV